MSKVSLVCKGVIFYSIQDEDCFFEWLKKIECIKSISAAGDELYLEIESKDISDEHLRNIIALFYRYKINMKQLQQFLNKENEEWFKGKPKGYWHRRIFGK